MVHFRQQHIFDVARFELDGRGAEARVAGEILRLIGLLVDEQLHALLEMAKTLPYKRIICAFQPHTYTRTKALFNDFVKELRVPDVVVLAEIYAAREQNDIGISSMDLSREIPGSVYCPTLDKVTAALARIACPGDLILTVGAGDIFKAGEKLLKEEK